MNILPGFGLTCTFNEVVMPDGMVLRSISNVGNISDDCELEARIHNAEDLLALEEYTRLIRGNCRDTKISLELYYLSAQRMDRAIDSKHSFTLKSYAEAINRCNFEKVYIHCPHSEVSSSLIDRSVVIDGSNVYKNAIFLATSKYGDISVVVPDLGGLKRFEKMALWNNYILCHKHRDMATGKLKSFQVLNGPVNETCLIIDDLCDGGRTFTGNSAELRKCGAKRVGLCVYHGIFSAGLPIEGIDFVYCTDSYGRNDAYKDVTHLFKV